MTKNTGSQNRPAPAADKATKIAELKDLLANLDPTAEKFEADASSMMKRLQNLGVALKDIPTPGAVAKAAADLAAQFAEGLKTVFTPDAPTDDTAAADQPAPDAPDAPTAEGLKLTADEDAAKDAGIDLLRAKDLAAMAGVKPFDFRSFLRTAEGGFPDKKYTRYGWNPADKTAIAAVLETFAKYQVALKADSDKKAAAKAALKAQKAEADAKAAAEAAKVDAKA